MFQRRSKINVTFYFGDLKSKFKVVLPCALSYLGFRQRGIQHNEPLPRFISVFSSTPAPAYGRGKRGVDLYLSRIPAAFPDDVTSWKWRLSIVGCAATTAEREVSSAAGVRCFRRSADWQHGELHINLFFIIGHRVWLYNINSNCVMTLRTCEHFGTSGFPPFQLSIFL